MCGFSSMKKEKAEKQVTIVEEVPTKELVESEDGTEEEDNAWT